MTDLVIAHLYPDLLRTYGDRGNVVALSRRAEWRGFSVRVEEVCLGEPLPPDANIVLLGGGTDNVQSIIGRDVASRAVEVRAAVARGAVVLGICGGYQLLGRSYVLPDGGVVQGLGVLDVETRASRDRLVGRVRGDATLWGRSFELVGFENHGGRTTVGPAAEPLAHVPRRHGNNGRDHGEGASQGGVLGTYLHGPVLAINPELTDAILARALVTLTGGEELERLDEILERRAHDGMARRARDDRRPARRRRFAIAGIMAVVVVATLGAPEAFERREDGDSGGRLGFGSLVHEVHVERSGLTDVR